MGNYDIITNIRRRCPPNMELQVQEFYKDFCDLLHAVGQVVDRYEGQLTRAEVDLINAFAKFR